MRKLGFVFVVAGAFAFAACGSDKKETTDGGTDAKVVKRDKGTTPEEDIGANEEGGITLPDKGTPGEGIVVGDGPSTFDCDRTKIGINCKQDPSNPNQPAPECGENAMCLVTSQDGSGICTCPCEPDDPNTPFTDEDKCAEGGTVNAICGELEMSGGTVQGFCLKICQPKFGGNDCEAPLACHPISAYYTNTEVPVCLFSGCETNDDCPMTTGESTDGTGFCDTADAASCPAGQTCEAMIDGSTKGRCSGPSTCDTASALCGAHATDKPNAVIGDPCGSDKDCGAYANCVQEVDRAALGQKDHGEACTADEDCCGGCDTSTSKCAGSCMVLARNGYCMSTGCGFATATDYKELACGAAGTCVTLFGPWGSCWKTCDPADGATCRGNANDMWGDYECIPWNAQIDPTYAPNPTCHWGSYFPCDAFVAYQLTCDKFNLVCKDPKTKQATTDPADPAGYCMDDSTSEPPTP